MQWLQNHTVKVRVRWHPANQQADSGDKCLIYYRTLKNIFRLDIFCSTHYVVGHILARLEARRSCISCADESQRTLLFLTAQPYVMILGSPVARGYLLSALLLFAGCLPIRGSECIITDGVVAQTCIEQSQNATQQLFTARVPLELRTQWDHVSGPACTECSCYARQQPCSSS
jgi:hypothetical protein